MNGTLVAIGLVGFVLSLVVAGAVYWLNRPAVSVPSTNGTPKASGADKAMLDAAVNLVAEGDPQTAIEVLQLHIARKKATEPAA
jgi:hypothetical protein